MDRIKNKQTEEIIQNKHNQLQSQQTLNQKEVAEHKQRHNHTQGKSQ